MPSDGRDGSSTTAVCSLLAAVLADRAAGGPSAELDAAAEQELRALGYL
jgi:hypothetical protein